MAPHERSCMISYMFIIQTKSLSLFFFKVFYKTLISGGVNSDLCRGKYTSDHHNVQQASGTRGVLCAEYQICPVIHLEKTLATDRHTDSYTDRHRRFYYSCPPPGQEGATIMRVKGVPLRIFAWSQKLKFSGRQVAYLSVHGF